MSLQEAASSGSFGPRAAQPTDPQRAGSPFDPPMVDGDPARAGDQSNCPFVNPYAISPDADATASDGGHDEMRAKRRRAWTVVSLAIVVPAAVAAIVAWQLFGSDSASAPTVTRVVTPTAEADTAAAEAVSTSVAVAVPASTETAAATETTVSTVTTTASASETVTSSTATAAAVETEEAVDLSGLDPAARLAAWTEIETIEVASGETLWLIAQNHGTTVSAIATLNNLSDPETLSVGQLLMIPVGFAEEVIAAGPAESGVGATESATDGSTALTTVAAGDGSLPADLASWQAIAPVSIETGDSLEAIAIANDTTVQAIMALNGITDPNLIYVGDVLLVPVGFQGEVPGIELTTATTSVETSVDTVQQASTTEIATSGDQLAADDEADQLAADDSLAADEGSDSDSLSE